MRRHRKRKLFAAGIGLCLFLLYLLSLRIWDIDFSGNSHFTEELLLEVLQKDAEEIDDVFSEGITEEDSAADILTLFLKEQKKELLRKKNNLTMAVYEYAFENKEKKDQMMRRQFEAGVRVLEKLIESGIASGEFYCENPKGAANNIMYVLEGMKINSQTMGITEAMVDEQLLYIMAGLLIDVD